MITAEKLLKDIENSKEGSVSEKVCIDIFMNMPECFETVNFIRAFHGPVVRETVVDVLNNIILENKKKEITKSLRVTLPEMFRKIKAALYRF